jgi:chromosome segregation ATPase
MSQSARVHSLDALKALHSALARYGPEALEALGAAEMEIRRTVNYLNDQLKYWKRQVEKCHEEVNRTHADLCHARAMRKGEQCGYVEQEIALNKARKRLKEADEKVVVVKRWLVQLPQDINEYQGPARRLAGMLDSDLKQGLAILNNKIDILEAYMAVSTAEPPASPPPPPPQGGTS